MQNNRSEMFRSFACMTSFTPNSKFCNSITSWILIKTPQNFVQGLLSIELLKIRNKNRSESVASGPLQELYMDILFAQIPTMNNWNRQRFKKLELKYPSSIPLCLFLIQLYYVHTVLKKIVKKKASIIHVSNTLQLYFFP